VYQNKTRKFRKRKRTERLFASPESDKTNHGTLAPTVLVVSDEPSLDQQRPIETSDIHLDFNPDEKY
jgi:hypothetical protein